MCDNLKYFSIVQGPASIVGLLVALLLAGCASSPPYSAADVELAAQQGDLEALYNDVDLALQRSRPGTEKHTSLTLVRNDLVSRLSIAHLEQISALLTAAEAGQLSLPELADLDNAIATIKPWKPYQAADLEPEAARLRSATEQEIASTERELAALTGEQVGQRYVAAMRLAHLEGGEQGEQRREAARKELDQTYVQGMAALEKKQLPEAQALFNEVAYGEPDYRDVVHNQGLVATGLFEQHFWASLVDSKPDEAYSVFYQFSRSTAFAAHRSQVALDAGDLAKYYDALGDKALRQRNWPDSYRAYQKASYIRTSLQLPNTPGQGMGQFLNEMERRYKAAERKGERPVAFAYLSVLERLYPQHELVSANMRYSQKEVLDQAAVQLALDRFQGEFGYAVTEGIRADLSSAPQSALRLVTHAQLPVDSQSSQVAYILRGDAVDGTVHRKRLVREEPTNVQIGTEPGPNPEYAAWKGLSRSDRAEIPEPPRSANLPVYDYVNFTYTDITSEASLMVHFELVEPHSGGVRLKDKVNKTSLEAGVETAPITLENFSQPAVAADMPTDREQMNGLAKDLATSITERLADWFKALDSQYADRAKTFAEQRKAKAATDSWAFAYVVSDPAGEQREELRTAMEEAVLAL